MIVGRDGLASQWALGRLHPINRLSAVEGRMDRVERFLVYQLRPHRRIKINGPDSDELALSDREAEYVFTSEDGSIVLSKGTDHPTRNNVVDWALNLDQLKGDLLEDTDWLDQICGWCDSATPPTWPPA